MKKSTSSEQKKQRWKLSTGSTPASNDSALSNSDDITPEGFRPHARAAPPPISSGISFRALPKVSLSQIISTCKHYEAKCSGKYSSTVPAARYLFQLSREVQVLAGALKAHEDYTEARVTELETTLKKWKTMVPVDSKSSNKTRSNTTTNAAVLQNYGAVFEKQESRLKEQSSEIQSLQHQLEAATAAAAESSLTDEERDMIKINTIIEKNTEIDEVKASYELRVKDLQKTIYDANNSRAALQDKCNSLQLQILELNEKKSGSRRSSRASSNGVPFDDSTASTLKYSHFEDDKYEAEFSDEDENSLEQQLFESQLKTKKQNQEIQRLMDKVNEYQEQATMGIKAAQEDADTRVEVLKQDYKAKTVEFQNQITEFQKYAKSVKGDFEASFDKELKKCESVTEENVYLKTRAGELQKIIDSYKAALRMDDVLACHYPPKEIYASSTGKRPATYVAPIVDHVL